MLPDEEELRITPLFVLNELKEHQKECSRRWWAVMCGVIANLILIIAALIEHDGVLR